MTRDISPEEAVQAVALVQSLAASSSDRARILQAQKRAALTRLTKRPEPKLTLRQRAVLLRRKLAFWLLGRALGVAYFLGELRRRIK